MWQIRTVVILSISVIFGFTACTSSIAPISGTPTADQVLSNARRVARQLDSYTSTRTVVKTTVYPRSPELNLPDSTSQAIEVASDTEYRVVHHALNYEFIRSNQTGYSRSGLGPWEAAPVLEPEHDLPPGEVIRPPAHPMEWLDRRYVVNNSYSGTEQLAGRPVYVIEGQIPMLPGAVTPDDRIPVDEIRLFIDTKSFQVIRIEIDQNILDSLREDSGYQVIPGVVEIDTREILEYARQNEEIRIEPPDIDLGS